MRLINTGQITSSCRLEEIKRIFQALCSTEVRKRVGKRRIKTYKGNDFMFKTGYATEWRMRVIKLIHGLSILYKPGSVPVSHVGINNPKNMCFAIVTIQVFLRCTRMMERIAMTPNNNRTVFSTLLFNSLVEIQSAPYTTQLLESKESTSHKYGQFPDDGIPNSDAEDVTTDISCMNEFRDGEPHGKC